jgi:hypothetical protein
MKKFLSIAVLGSLLFGCGPAKYPVTPEIVACREKAVISVLGDVAGRVIQDVMSGKADLVTVLTQAGATFNDVFAAVKAYQDCAPTDPTNPMLPNEAQYARAAIPK